MAIQQINLGSMPLGAGGDTQRAANEKINQNFSNTTHAASRLVGVEAGNVMEVGAFGLGVIPPIVNLKIKPTETKFFTNFDAATAGTSAGSVGVIVARGDAVHSPLAIYHMSDAPHHGLHHGWWDSAEDNAFKFSKIYSEINTTKDSNGFLKSKSPVTRLFSDRLEHQGNDKELKQIEFEKLGLGDYLLKNTTGLANEGWYIETPKDANGNVLVAVVYEQLENKDISIKTYDYMLNKKGRIVPDTDTPLDIPETRWIDLRFNEFEQEQLDEPIE